MHTKKRKHIKTSTTKNSIRKRDIANIAVSIASIAIFCSIIFVSYNTANAEKQDRIQFEKTIAELASVDKPFNLIPTVKPDIPEYIADRRFKEIARFVIVELEGDDKVSKEPNGGIAKFGINSKAHPNVDVAHLTREKAYRIAKRKYWDAINADSLPRSLQLIAFDTAFHHGTGKAKQLIKIAKKCPDKLIVLRKREYNRLVTANPSKYARFKNGWYNRLDKLIVASL